MQPLKQPASLKPAWDHEVRRLGGVLAAITLQEIERRRFRGTLPGSRPAFRSGDFVTIPSPWASALTDARHDPEGYVVRVRVREIGWRLCALGGLDAMRECLAAIENEDTVSYVDAAWAGIGVSASQMWFR